MRYAFIGAGRLGSAIMEALVKKGTCLPDEIGCTSLLDGTAPAVSDQLQVRFFESTTGLLEESDTVVLAIKPQQLASLDPSVAEKTRGSLVISVLAGTPLDRLGDAFPRARNIVRTMPNTPARIGVGITAFCARVPLEPDDQRQVDDLLSAMGASVPVTEKDMDAVTAVSGSGPAYVFEFVAALRDAGCEAGLGRDVAYKLALETVLGSVRLLARLGKDPETLRDEVTSPNGTTVAALDQLEKAGFRAMINKAVLAAKTRSEELSSES
jgi:pyrroline-5-carboxylate reductase